MVKWLALPLALVAATGCTSLKVTYYSEPPGATVYANNSEQRFGYAPVTLKYQPPPGFWGGSRCWDVQVVKVRWISGAEAAAPTVHVCPQNGHNQQLVFQRPTGVPGVETDARFAVLMQQLAIQQANQEAATWAAVGQALAAQRVMQCTSNVIGSTVYTTCR